jgi:adenosylhomocysteinase
LAFNNSRVANSKLA